jgi:transcriptional regulator with XRE-family HTH domain
MLFKQDDLVLKYRQQICTNLQTLLDNHSVNILELSRQIKSSYSSVYNLVNSCNNPTLETLSKVANFFDISITQIIGDLPLTEINKYIHIKSIPILKFNEITQHLENSNQLISNDFKRTLIASTKYDISENAFAVISTSKEEPIFQSGTILYFDQLSDNVQSNNNKFIIASINDFLPVLMKCIIDGGDCYIKSCNPNIPAQKLNQETRIIATLIQIKTEF